MTLARFSQATDQELMRHVQSGDAEAFGVLYDRLAPTALGVARGVLCADVDRAQDAVQDGFLSIWRARAQYQPERGEVRAWAFGIVRNRALDTYRGNGRHDRHRSDAGEIEDNLHGPEEVQAGIVADDEARRLRALLAGLPLAQREVVTLAYYGELSQSEIAQELALPIGTVKGRMRLGLIKLREHAAP